MKTGARGKPTIDTGNLKKLDEIRPMMESIRYYLSYSYKYSKYTCSIDSTRAIMELFILVICTTSNFGRSLAGGDVRCEMLAREGLTQ
jgi:hypothetical protein